MSSRQMRRLQDLLDRATGLDAAEEGEGDGETAAPSTAQTKKSADRHHEKKRRQKERDREKKRAAAATEEATPAVKPSPDPAPSTGSATAKLKKAGRSKSQDTATSPNSPTADEWEEVEEEDDGHSRKMSAAKDSVAHKRKSAHVDEEAGTAAQAEEVKRRKKEERRKLRQQQQRQKQAEEDALLDAVLANQADSPHAAEAADGDNNNISSTQAFSNAAGAAHTSIHQGNEMGTLADATTSLQCFVMACDPQQLDTRLERIRMFGADAVEDVGDGRTPHRRADGRVRDTGSVSFFPAHHAHVKFLHSAFATPNRHRWIPYDGLGVYLKAEEGGGTSGQTWRDYTLNCDSNAFQRALAQLSACQDRMGGVQDLVECLARNKVYHIPTLLQCVYAMEATGESAFAGELLDVALYQVGVLLRRFALSGAWAQRQLPMTRGGNSLVFQVLQRGVHTALKRGCLRTAFERTRCLLSLDQRDPCGMLLLLDYTALRAKRWVWLLEMRHRVCTSTGSAQNSSLERAIMALPNYAFSWALAKHFIEREERLQSSGNEGGGGGGGRPSKVLRGITDAQREALAATAAAEELLTMALTRFPHAAVRLVNALGGVDVVCGTVNSSDSLPVSDHSVWFADIVVRAENETSDEALQQSHLAGLFVARHEELWKLNECVALLRAAVRALVYEPKAASSKGVPASPITRSSPLLDPYAYLDLTQEAVLGVSVAPIPADLLRPDAADFAIGDGDGEGEGGDMLRVNPAMAEELLRMLRQNIESGDEDDARQQYLQQLEAELDERLRRGRLGGGVEGGRDAQRDYNPTEHAVAGELDWFDYDDEEAEDVETQDWYSVASAEDSNRDDASEEGQSYEDPQ
ncbi:hypothetical protein ABL78_6516 [Leptomonas seymouri]|uniref:Uncharacterized protein n=1 Tax=Leptomonas seymouri TaxID=5684 RepID=A0A0N1I0Q4_LEPSE|nr:hypothetical protein ABL78_6516 [Leptomonas seymouri]|eukprot:KPI84434.1 hypothetical protein ABL78_6516 [Leptomonas seymouri]